MKGIVRSYGIVYVQKVSDTKYNKRFGTIWRIYKLPCNEPQNLGTLHVFQ